MGTKLFTTVDLPDNPPNETPPFTGGGSLEAGDWCYVQVLTAEANGDPVPYVGFQLKLYDPVFDVKGVYQTYTGLDGTALIRLQTPQDGMPGMWTASANISGQGSAITFPVRAPNVPPAS